MDLIKEFEDLKLKAMRLKEVVGTKSDEEMSDLKIEVAEWLGEVVDRLSDCLIAIDPSKELKEED